MRRSAVLTLILLVLIGVAVATGPTKESAPPRPIPFPTFPTTSRGSDDEVVQTIPATGGIRDADGMLAEIARVADEITPGGSGKVLTVDVRVANLSGGSTVRVPLDDGTVAGATLISHDDPVWEVKHRDQVSADDDTFAIRDIAVSLDEVMNDAESQLRDALPGATASTVAVRMPMQTPVYADGQPSDLPVITVSGRSQDDTPFASEYRADGEHQAPWFDAGDVAAVLADIEEVARRVGTEGDLRVETLNAARPAASAQRAAVSGAPFPGGYYFRGAGVNQSLTITHAVGEFPRVSINHGRRGPSPSLVPVSDINVSRLQSLLPGGQAPVGWEVRAEDDSLTAAVVTEPNGQPREVRF